jgi:serine/threonine-protein kinase RsbW
MVQLRLPARPEMLAVTREIIERVAVAAGLPRALADDARLAVTEAAANVVMHAYPDRDGADAVLLLEVRADDEALRVVVADEGVGIGGREGTSGAGLGLPLVRHLASEVRVDTGPQGTRVELRFAAAAS